MKKIEISPKAKKIINIVVDVVVAVILFFAVFLAVNTIRSKAKGYDQYTEILGKAYLSVSSDSMDAPKPEGVADDKPEGFKKGDMITVRMLSKGGLASLEVGDIITYKTTDIILDKNGQEKWVLNTHRIVEITEYNEGNYKFRTKGDNNFSEDQDLVNSENVVGIYEGHKVKNVGFVMMFMGSSTGFIIFVLVPSLLIVAYAAFNLIMVIKKEKKVQTEAADSAHSEELAAERERIRQELLAEMHGNAGSSDSQSDATVSEAEAEESSVSEPKTEEATVSDPQPAESEPEKSDKDIAAEKNESKDDE